MRKPLLTTALAAALTLSAVAIAGNAPDRVGGAVAPKASNASISVTQAFTNCTSVTVIGTITYTADAGVEPDEVILVIFDDGEVKAQLTLSIPAGATDTLPFNINYPDPEIGTAAPGIGVYLFDGPGLVNQIAAIDPQTVQDEENCDGSPIGPGAPPALPQPNVVPAGGTVSLGLLAALVASIGLGWMVRSRR
jgi:hypothetical protein